jgi:hypothetical protein
MTEPVRPAPDPIGDVVPGQPLVPITVWQVPAPPRTATLSLPLAQRLVANYTHRHDLVLDLTAGPQLARAAMSARRRTHRQHSDDLDASEDRREPAALPVAPWPADVKPPHWLATCAARLAPGGCLVLVLATGEVSIHPRLVTAARSAGRTYLQHIIAAHQLRTGGTRLSIDGRHLRVHSDIVVLARPRHSHPEVAGG